MMSFWKAENVFYVVASVDSNIRGFKRSVQHEKCSFICLYCPSEILEPLAKWKTQFMLGNYELDKVHLKRKGSTLCIRTKCMY